MDISYGQVSGKVHLSLMNVRTCLKLLSLNDQLWGIVQVIRMHHYNRVVRLLIPFLEVDVIELLQLRPDLARSARIVKDGESQIQGTWLPYQVRLEHHLD